MWTEEYDVAAARDANRAFALQEQPEEVAEVADLDADGVPVRLFRPAGADPGLLVHLHGGGFVFHDLDVHDRPCRRLANRLGMAVLSVDYRLAPEHRFPAAPDDVDTVLTWLDHGGAELTRGGPTYVHGDSAGGNLALVAGAETSRAVPGGGAALPVPGPAGRVRVVRARCGRGLRSARGAVVLAAVRRRCGGPDQPRPGATPVGPARHACRRRWSPPPSTTRCATRASTSLR